LPICDWRKHMKAHPDDYATIGLRAWLRSRHKCIRICRPEKLVYVSPVQKHDKRGG
jgi:hypothetical protein